MPLLSFKDQQTIPASAGIAKSTAGPQRLSSGSWRELLKQSQTFLMSLESDSDESGDDVQREKAVQVICDLIDRATISVETYEDQTASVVIATAIPFQRVMEFVAAESTAK